MLGKPNPDPDASFPNPAVILPEQELSPDVEYLLSGLSIDVDRLAEALVENYFTYLFDLSRAILPDEQQAHNLAVRTLAEAAANAYRYNRQTSSRKEFVRGWLVGIALRLLAGKKAFPSASKPSPQAKKIIDGFLDDFQDDVPDGFPDGFPNGSPHGFQDGFPDGSPGGFLKTAPGLEENQETVSFSPSTGQWQQINASPTAEKTQLLLALLPHLTEEDLLTLPSHLHSPPIPHPSLPPTSHELRATSHKLPPTSHQPSAISYQLQATTSLTHRLLLRQHRLAGLKSALLVSVVLLGFALAFGWMNRMQNPAGDSLAENPGVAPNSPLSALLPPPPTPTPIWLENAIYASILPESIASIADRFDLPEAELRRLNSITDPKQEFPETAFYLPVPEINFPLLLPYPRLYDQLLEPLPADASQAEILTRLQESHRLWRTLWMDVEIADLTNWLPNNQLIPNRTQVWVAQPDRSLEIFGFTSDQADERHIMIKGYHYFTIAGLLKTIQSIGLPDRRLLIYNPKVRDLVFPLENIRLLESGEFRSLGKDVAAGRQAVIVEWTNPEGMLEYRFWIESQLGVLLRIQQLEPTSGTLLNDRRVTRLEVNFEIPSRYFDPLPPWQASFSQDQHVQPDQGN